MELAWEEYLEDLEDLRDRVRSVCMVSGVGAICQDGVLPSVYLAAQLGVEWLTGHQLAVARMGGKSVLGVAGYVASGDPDGKLWALSRDPNAKTAVLYAGARLPVKPDIIGRTVDGDVIFPYQAHRAVWRR